MRRLVLVLGLALVLAPVAAVRAEEAAPLKRADIPEVLKGLDGKAIWETTKEFCDDKMLGRKTGFQSGEDAETWVAMKMMEMGLHPADAGGTYLEPFRFDSANTKAPIELKIGDKSLVYGTDFFDLIYGGDAKVAAEVVFCGYGIHRPDADWDDYAGVDVKGKIVMAIRGAPAQRRSEFVEERFIGYKSSTAADQGAVGFILVEGAKASTGTIQSRFHRITLPAVWATEGVADQILEASGKRFKKLKSARDAGKAGTSFATGTKVHLEVHSKLKKNALGHNVLGMIRGRDPDLVNEIIMIGAHLDHLGLDPNGKVFNGADDNASGTAVMLHIADQLTLKHWKPKRTIVFCGFAGEEQGLHGAEALSKYLPFQHDGVVCLLNMDMVGQGEPKIRISGVGSYPKVHALLKQFVPTSMEDQVGFSLRTAPSGDHWPFYNRGIPAFFIGTAGKHPNYHTLLDDIERIKPELLDVTAKAVGTWLVRLGEHPEPLLDPRTPQQFLLREGPRFQLASGPEALHADVDALLRAGISSLIVDLPADEQGVATLKALRAQAKAKDGRVVIAHSASGLMNAYRRSKIGLVLRARAGANLAADPAAMAALRKQGFKIVAPFVGAPEAVAKLPEILAAAKAAKVLVDLAGLDAVALAQARKALGTYPAVLLHPLTKDGAAETKALQAAAGKQTLFVLIPGTGARALDLGAGGPTVVCMADTDALCDQICTACQAVEGIWWAPRTKTRLDLRRRLGGNLITWMRKAK